MVIDSHAHIGESNGRIWTPKELITSMDEASIDYSLVIAESSEPNEPSHIANVLKAVHKYPRLKIVVDCHFATLNTNQITNIIGLLEQNSVVGVKFYLGYEKYYPYDKRLFPIYEFCQKNNKPVIFHTGMLEAGDQGLLKYAHPLTIDEVASLFPDLKIVMAHMGNPWLLDCAAVLAKNKNVYADMSGFFEENMPITHNDSMIFKNRMLDVELFLGSFNKFLFGTDWPLYNQKEYLQAIQTLKLDKEEKELVFWKNAVKIFNLKI